MGAALLDRKLYVCSHDSNEIQVFDSSANFTEMERVTLPLSTKPLCLAACPVSQCIYINDMQERCIFRVNCPSSERLEHAKKFIVTDYAPYALSVQSGRLLVTPFGCVALYVYGGGSGNEVRRVPVPDHMAVRHAVETPTGTYVICNEANQASSQGSHPAVAELDAEGRVLRRYEGPRSVRVDLPWSLTVDGGGRILVAERFNSQVLHLNCNLQLNNVLVSLTDGQPYRIAHCKDSGLLSVSIYRTGKVHIYQIAAPRHDKVRIETTALLSI